MIQLWKGEMDSIMKNIKINNKKTKKNEQRVYRRYQAQN